MDSAESVSRGWIALFVPSLGCQCLSATENQTKYAQICDIKSLVPRDIITRAFAFAWSGLSESDRHNLTFRKTCTWYPLYGGYIILT